MDCVPSDNSLELHWLVSTGNGVEMIPPGTGIEGSADIIEGSADVMNRDGGFDDEDEILNISSNLTSRFQYQLPSIHQLTLINTTMTDSGHFECRITPPPNEERLDIYQQIILNVLPSKLSCLHELILNCCCTYRCG